MRIIKPSTFWGLSLAALLTACGGATYLAHTWSLPVEIPLLGDSHVKTVTRELSNGNIRLAHRSDDKTLIVNTYDPSGTLLDQHTFDLPGNEPDSSGEKPVFLNDDLIFWPNYNYPHSQWLDLNSGSTKQVPAIPESVMPADARFHVSAQTPLGNGQLVLGGYQYPGVTDSFDVRLVIVNPDDTILSDVIPDAGIFFPTILPKGDDQYFVFSPFDDNIQIRQGVTIIDDIALSPSRNSPAHIHHADDQGIWYSHNGSLRFRDISGTSSWEMRMSVVHSVTPVSDGSYLVLESPYNPSPVLLHKFTLDGTLLWTTNITLKNITAYGKVSERNGVILVSHESFRTEPSFIVDDSVEPAVTTLTGNRKGAIAHLQLNLAGKITHRYIEPEYRALLLRDMENLQEEKYTEVLEYTEGACRLLDVIQLSSGDILSVSDWCGSQESRDPSAKIHYFSQP